MADIDIYDLLTTVSLQDATLTQLNTATGRTKVDRNSIEFWQGVLTVAHTMKQTRTNLGLPIPESVCVDSATVADSGFHEFGPASSSEIWRLQNFLATGLDETQNGFPLPVNAGGFLQYPIYVTKISPILFNNGTGGSLTAAIQYNVVSL